MLRGSIAIVLTWWCMAYSFLLIELNECILNVRIEAWTSTSYNSLMNQLNNIVYPAANAVDIPCTSYESC